MNKIQKYSLIVPVSVVLMWLLSELYGALGLIWSNGFTLQYTLIFFLLGYALIEKEKSVLVRVFLVLGGVFCLVGDTFLANAFRNHFSLGVLRMPLGMAGFFIGHTFWYLAILGFKDPLDKKKTFVSFGVTFGVLIILWFLLINNDFDLLSFLALIYCVALGTPLAHSIAQFGKQPAYKLLTVFYTIFILSDMIIGMKDIKGIDIPAAGFLIWFTYIIALAGIVYSLVLHRKVQENA